MHIGFLSTKQACEFLPHMEKLLARKGHEIACSVCVSGEVDFAETLNYVAMQSQAIIYYGDRNRLFDTLKNDYNVDPKQSVFELNDTFYAVMDEYNESFVRESIIPMLNGRCKTLYTTEIFKTFGREENELKDLLKNHIKNRNRIVFSFYPSVCECEVAVRYSSKMPRDTVNAVVGGARAALKSFTYSESDTTLAECVVKLLKAEKKKVCVAESFTGGAVASSLTLCAGASEVFEECVVCYANESKIRRVGVERATVETFGAVSADTVYEMAANMLVQSGCDICLATSGNAGPTAERDGEVGKCYIAVGDSDGIHIFEHNFLGDRKYVTECGVKYALYYLFKQLKFKESFVNEEENKE